MKKQMTILLFSLIFFGCDKDFLIDTTPPASPRGLQVLALDNSVQIDWLKNTEPDVAGYHIWVSERYDGRYLKIGTTTRTTFEDLDAKNALLYYYGVTAYDFEGNESEMSRDVIYATPRPEGFGVWLSNFATSPNNAGYDFSTYSIGKFNDEYTDVYYETYNGRYYLNVWEDSDILDMGYTESLDDITIAPTAGWVPSRSVEAVPGHLYIIWTWDDHYAKVRVREAKDLQIKFDWAYQLVKGNLALKRNLPPDGKRKIEMKLHHPGE
ncbi:MAG: hypothetical protein V1799_17685 [bacterium]